MKTIKILSFILCVTLLFSIVGMIYSFAVIDPCTSVPDTDKHTVIDFFESVGAKEAVDIIKADKMKKTKLGNKLDATNLNNLANAVQVIRDVNTYRAKEAKLENRNLPELKVTHRLMANAIVNCNYSSYVRGHANNYEKGYRVVAECLAWGLPDPAFMWYNHPVVPEKDYFNQGKYNAAGHYINLYVDSKSYKNAHDYDLAGAAVSMYTDLNKNGWCCCILTATGYPDDKAFSVDEYTKLVNDYIDSITEDTTVAVPEVVKNESLNDVKDRLKKLGFNVKTEGVADSSVGAGKVIKTDPAPGTRLPYGSTVTIYYAEESKPEDTTVVVPEVKKTESLNDVRAKLEKMGFKVKTEGIADSSVGAGKVIKTDPAPGTRLPYGSTVTVYYAKADKGIKGDVTEDGSVLADDARLALRASANLDQLTESQIWAADVDEDDKVLAEDARQILRFSAKIQTSFVKK
ncbi:MAG: PASTA domain-containing protein [Clostridia bacterium]|nr:PASTA domain-containing protein [Clostridia bacterium]